MLNEGQLRVMAKRLFKFLKYFDLLESLEYFMDVVDTCHLSGCSDYL